MNENWADISTIKSPNQCLSWWLVHNYLYYVEGECVISDNDWRMLGSWLQQSWEQVTHRHKHLVTDVSSIASTGAMITEYPEIVRSTAMMVLRWSIARSTAMMVLRWSIARRWGKGVAV